MEKYLKNKKSLEIFNEKEWYKEKIIEMVNQIESESALKKIYTFAKTLNDISKEEGI